MFVSIFSMSAEEELKKKYSVSVTRRYGLFVEMEFANQEKQHKAVLRIALQFQFPVMEHGHLVQKM